MARAPFTFLEFFAGGGMARLGLADQFTCVLANDNDARKCAAYRANFGGAHLIEADIADLKASEIPSADLAWASFPCQDLSLAGNRGGLSSARSGTFWAFWDLMTAMKQEGRAPGVIVIENVTGLLTSHAGKDFAALVQALGEGGYRVSGAVIDAAAFVPQSRPRVFIVAWQAELASPPQAAADASPLLLRAVDGLPAAAQRFWHPAELPEPARRTCDLVDILETAPPPGIWRTSQDLEKLLGQMTALHRARVAAAVSTESLRVGAVYRRIRKGVQRAEVRYDGLAGCLRTLKGGSSRQLLLISEQGELGLRPMLPREAARLMGLPPSYVLPKSATAAISLCGDGVCVPAVAWLSRHLLAPLLHQNTAIGLSGKRIGVH